MQIPGQRGSVGLVTSARDHIDKPFDIEGSAMKKEVTQLWGTAIDCPCCLGNNLHQKSVSVFFRNEDSPDGIFKKVDLTGVEYAHPSKNPSPRRDGMLISFFCETCDSDPELAIYQHKGSTYLEWHSVRTKVVA